MLTISWVTTKLKGIKFIFLLAINALMSVFLGLGIAESVRAPRNVPCQNSDRKGGLQLYVGHIFDPLSDVESGHEIRSPNRSRI